MSVLRRIDDQRIGRQRFPGGSAWILPGTMPVGACRLPAAPAVSVAADSDALSQFLDGLTRARAVPLTLVDGHRSVAAGQLCAADDGAGQIWELPR